MAIDSIERELCLPVSLERAWEAVATPKGICSWFCHKAQFTPVIGEDMQLEWDGSVLPTRVETVNPPHEFAFRWMVHGADLGEPLSTQNSTLITFRFEETDDGIRIVMHESGFATLAVKYQNLSRPEHEQGWTEELPKLKRYLCM